MEKTDTPKSSRVVGYLAAAVALLAVAFIVLVACATYLIENNECEDGRSAESTAVAAPEACDEFYYEGNLGNTTYTEYTTVCEDARTEFGIVRDKATGFIMNTFYGDYKQGVSMVYLARSHKCLLSHEMNSFEDNLDNYRNQRYGLGPYPYSVGEPVSSWDEIAEDMRGFCSPRNTFRWQKHEAAEEDTDDHRSKRHYTHLCCCFFFVGPYLYLESLCTSSTTCYYDASVCVDVVFGHWHTCPTSRVEACIALLLNG